MTPTSSTVRGVARTVSFPLLANQILVCNLSNLDEPIPRLFSFENSTPARRFAFAPPRCALAARIRLSSGPRCRGRMRWCLTSGQRLRDGQETGSAIPPGRPCARKTVPLSRRRIARRGFPRWSIGRECSRCRERQRPARLCARCAQHRARRHVREGKARVDNFTHHPEGGTVWAPLAHGQVEWRDAARRRRGVSAASCRWSLSSSRGPLPQQSGAETGILRPFSPLSEHPSPSARYVMEASYRAIRAI